MVCCCSHVLHCSSVWLQYSLCNESLIELSNPGASGSLFYLSRDDEYIIKTVQHKEAEFLQKLLPGYFMVRFAEEYKVNVLLLQSSLKSSASIVRTIC